MEEAIVLSTWLEVFRGSSPDSQVPGQAPEGPDVRGRRIALRQSSRDQRPLGQESYDGDSGLSWLSLPSGPLERGFLAAPDARVCLHPWTPTSAVREAVLCSAQA